MSLNCLNNKEVNITTALILSFLLAKKSTLVISQLAKFVKQGNSRDMSMNNKTRDNFHKTDAYKELYPLISTLYLTKINK